MIINQIIKSKPSINLKKLIKKPEQGVIKKVFVCRNSKAYDLVFYLIQIITTK
jgi:hypothetical protein